ncbi:DNA repair protein [Schizosaccharomyces cryophilus OY26]|uniref:Mitochondrial genome maintenance protein MGM101 n=1 Tax=Schizosaccharomyces cryophilus (strain OY26 / ATCC MYA-4695 / CBS 11777 / NBRC 106824 / NRRL Y48691) TaxID=653667 RepID=S9W1S0_SCHCR|nr:DNA repair protein [Schizosaccharomyces cryophilus OY26]EPY53983.1 DNA repair protein [Schizosaccharomyces cryophilus OY26]
MKYTKILCATTRNIFTKNSYKVNGSLKSLSIPRSSQSLPAVWLNRRPFHVSNYLSEDRTTSKNTNGNIKDIKNESGIPSNMQESNIPDMGPNWETSFYGLSAKPFDKETSSILTAPLSPEDVEIKPDGILYLPEIKYRRILNNAFGPGGWGLAPRGNTTVTSKSVSREYALVCHGRLVSVARGEQTYFDPEGVATASEGCKSNALMRCCKDLGVASELWDPRFIRAFKRERCMEVFVENVLTKKKRKLWRRKEDKFTYPYAE